MQIGALFASRQPISSNPGAVLLPRLSKINITPDATVIRITVPIPSADWLYTKPIHTAMDIDAITFKVINPWVFVCSMVSTERSAEHFLWVGVKSCFLMPLEHDWTPNHQNRSPERSTAATEYNIYQLGACQFASLRGYIYIYIGRGLFRTKHRSCCKTTSNGPRTYSYSG